jgi:hypothetical protein
MAIVKVLAALFLLVGGTHQEVNIFEGVEVLRFVPYGAKVIKTMKPQYYWKANQVLIFKCMDPYTMYLYIRHALWLD